MAINSNYPKHISNLIPETEQDKMRPKLKLGIVGHGFVGKAVDYAFTHRGVEKFYVDPKYGTTIDDLVEWQPNFTFICAPTPMSEAGFVDASIVEDACLKLLEHTKGGVVIKSTVTPDIVGRIMSSIYEEDIKRIVINPEFLTESSANEAFINAEYHILGGHPEATQALAKIYDIYSLCTNREFLMMTAPEAAYVKYSVNSFLAMKVTFFNQLYQSCHKFGVNWPTVVNAVGRDPRIGIGHTRVPGYDGKRGFGGACFPKDTRAFTLFDEDLTLLAECVNINNEYRKQYDLDKREESNNVNYGQTEEEQQNQDD